MRCNTNLTLSFCKIDITEFVFKTCSYLGYFLLNKKTRSLWTEPQKLDG